MPGSAEVAEVSDRVAELWPRKALRALLLRERVGREELVGLVAPWVVTSLEMTMAGCLCEGEVGARAVAEAIVDRWLDELCSPEGQIGEVVTVVEQARGRVAVAVLGRLLAGGAVSAEGVAVAARSAAAAGEVLAEDAELLVEGLRERAGRVA